MLELVCFSHLRWGFVCQRPQHILRRFAQKVKVHVWEEPEFGGQDAPRLRAYSPEEGVRVLTPVLPAAMRDTDQTVLVERALLDDYLAEQRIAAFLAWYYTPMALRFTEHLHPTVTVYDCMDELSAFQGAPPALIHEEKRLFQRADVVFAGGASLYASKRTQHANVHLFPSSVDREHFGAARSALADPRDQADVPHPRIGFYGVLDERLDRNLIRDVAALHPEWQFVLIGPVVKVREEDLPRAENIHYLGQKNYGELPSYLANWDVAMLPFARNASTRFISPTKTPEYLAGGKPVVSTPIQDVVTPYGDRGLVRIGETAAEFSYAIEQSLQEPNEAWVRNVDTFLADISWDKTFEGMWAQVQARMPGVGRAKKVTEQAEEEVEANV